MTDQSPSAGWYPAPDGTPAERWWDGQQWTDYTQAAPSWHERQMLELAQAQAREAKRATRHVDGIKQILIFVLAMAILAAIVFGANNAINH